MDSLLNYLLIIIISFGGGFVQRVSGFGFGIFVMLFSPDTVPSTIRSGIGNISKSNSYCPCSAPL